MIVNYTLTEPEIRIHVPVGVAYDSDPENVRKILLNVAKKNRYVMKERPAEVWFSEYGESALHFRLLVWIDIRHIAREEVRSLLYYELFQALKAAGIQIPYPQRDIHIISTPKKPVQAPEPAPPSGA